MKLNSTDQYLSLILQALDAEVLPGVKQLAGVKFTVDLIRSTVDDLLKRRGPSIPLLKKCIEAGEILEDNILSKLAKPSRAGHQRAYNHEDNFDTLAARYDELTETLNLLCGQLSAVSGHDSHVFALLHRAALWELMYYKELQQLKSEPFKDSCTTALKNPPLTKEILEEFLISRHGSLEVASFERLPGGFGKQTFMSTIRYPKGDADEIVLRKSDAAPFITHKGFQLQWEHDLLLSLKKVDFPAPEPIDLATQLPGVDMEFFSMKKIRGQILSPFFDSFDRSFDEGIWLQLAEKLAKLHAIPLDTFTDHLQRFEPSTLKSTTEECYHRNIKDWEQYLADVDHLASPCTTWIFNWLKHHVPKDSRRPVLVHGDFNVHNVLVDGSQITGILDWETSIFGAPEHDLAYIQPHVSRYIDWQKFLDHYKLSGGQDLNLNHFNFYLAYTLMSFALGVSHATWNLQQGLNRDIRFVACEFGFTPYIYQAIVDCATPDSESPSRLGQGEIAPSSEPLEHRERQQRQPAVIENHVAEKPKQSDLRMHIVPAKDGSDLKVFGDETNFRQKPGPQANWQDSVVLVWWDEKNQIGGFHRLGHESNFEGGRVLLWNNLTSPEGIYKRDHYLPLREEDKLPNGGFGGGDETCRYEFIKDEHLWTIADGDVSARISFKDHGPNVDCFPKKGTLASEFAPQHFDIPGDITGWMEIKGRKYEINGLGLRDKGWGTRDWHALLSHRWVAGSCGPALGFVALAFHTVDDQLISFGWVVRDGKITFAESLDIVAYYELDSATNRGGHLQYVLTDGEVLEIECTPVPGKGFVSYQKGICCVDRLCTVTCNEYRGVCDFETTANIQQGTRRPRKFSAGIFDNGFHTH